MVQLRERAAHLVKHLEPEDVDGPAGLSLIFSTLEASPIIKQNERHRVDYHRRRLLSLNRMPHESLESYITRAGIYKSQLETLDASLAMGDRFYVGHLLDHSRLTRKDRVMVKARAGGEGLEEITAALVEMAPELEGEQGYPIGQAEPQLGGANGEEHLVQRNFTGIANRFKKAAFVADTLEEMPGEEMHSMADPGLDDNLGEDSLDEQADNLEVLHAEHEALAMQFRARQKIAEIRKLRNFYKKSDPEERKRLLQEKMKSNPCHTCGEYGHWSRECPKGKNAVNPVLVTQSENGNYEADQWGLLVSLCSSGNSCTFGSREVYMVQRQLGGGEDHVTPVGSHDACWSLHELAKCVILDLGCMRNVVGVQWMNDVLETWQRFRRWFRVHPEQETFRFGDGNSLVSKYRVQLLATFGGRPIVLGFSVVEGSCPPLLSKQSHQQLGVVLDCAKHTLSSSKLRLKDYGLEETKGGHYIMRIDEFGGFEEKEPTVPSDFVMQPHEEVHLVLNNECEAFGSGPLRRDKRYGDEEEPIPSSVKLIVPRQSEAMSSLRPDGPSDCGLPGADRRRRLLSSHGRVPYGDAGGCGQHGPQEQGEGSIINQGVSCGGSDYTTSEDYIRSRKTSDRAACGDQECGDNRSGGDGSSRTDEVRRDDFGRGKVIGEEQIQEGSGWQQEGSDGCLDGMVSRLSVSQPLLEQRGGVQHGALGQEQNGDIPLEEAVLATQGEGSSETGESGSCQVAQESSMAQRDAGKGGGGSLRALWSYEAEVAGTGCPEPHVNKPHRPNRGLTQRLKQGVKSINEKMGLLEKAMGLKSHYILLEIYAGTAMLSRVARRRQGWEVLDPVDLVFGDDLTLPEHRERVLQVIKQEEPDLVTLSPRCGPWSQFQRLTTDKEKMMEKRKEDLVHWRFVRVVWDLQDGEGRMVMTENPWQSEALKLTFMKSRPHLHRAKVAQCQFGLKDVISGKPHQKWTAFDVNNIFAKEYLEKDAGCICERGDHQPIEGCVYYQGARWRRSQLASRWPARLCDHLLQAAQHAWSQEIKEVNLLEPFSPEEPHYALPVEAEPSPEAEMRKQMEKVDGQGNRYDYIYFAGEARMTPYRVRQVVSQLHVTLGHPSEERLVRMLMVNGGGEVLCKAARGLKCQVCEAVRPPQAEPKVSGRRVTRFNDKLLGDSFFIWDAKGQRFSVTHLIDSLTEYHVGLLNKNPNAEDTRELLQNRWCAIFGPPDLLQTDGGKEFAEGVIQLTRVLDFKHDVVPPGAKWRQGQVERHGGILKLMMMRVVEAQQAEGLQTMRLVATACLGAKNRMVNKLGLSPLQAVTGRNTSIPTSLVDQVASGCIKEALNRELQQGDSLKRAERIRAAACDAFHWLDTNEALRRALHSRSRPPRMELVREGATVYVHAVPPARRGLPRRLQDHKSWDGPGLVVCVERLDGLPKRVWVRIRSKLHSYPLEKIRLATPDEMLGSHYILDAMKAMEAELNEGKLLVQPVEEEEPEQPPLPEQPYPSPPPELAQQQLQQERPASEQPRPDSPQQLASDSEEGLSDGTVWRLLEQDEECDEERAKKVRRMEALDDFPLEALRPKERRPRDSEDEQSLPEPSRFPFPKKQRMFEDWSQKGGGVLGEAQIRGQIEKTNYKVRQLKKGLYKQKAQEKRKTVKSRGDAASSSLVFWTEAGDGEHLWREVEEEQEIMGVYMATVEQEEEVQKRSGEESKKAEEDFKEAKIVTGKARLEYQWRQLDEEWKEAFHQPLLKGVKVYFDHDAVEGVAKDKMIDPRKILGSRFVLTNKGGPLLAEAELKARWILGGHLDPEAGKYPTLAPTASSLGHNLINFIAVQKSWVVHYEDVSAAFLQGHRLPREREIYVRLPKGYPPYISEFIQQQLGSECRDDLVRLTKGGFGLPESPRLWYLEYKHTLEALGVMEMALLPGVFRAFHEDGRMRALACIHVDDTRYCGDETSHVIWEGLHSKLKFGALRKATDEEVKFCGRWEHQCPETFEFTYSMVPYGEKLYKMKPREEGDTTLLSSEEKLEMSSLVGQLNWQSRQGRYDLGYGVSHVQQLMAKNDPEAIVWLNKVVYRAKQPMLQKIPKIDEQDMVVISASDAAYGSQPGGHSQGGMVIGIGDQRMLDGEGPFCVLEAASMKIQRVVRCSMSAEVSMAASSYEHGDFIRASMAEMMCKGFHLRDWKLWASRWRHFLVIDAKTGFDVLSNESQTSDRKIQIDLAVLKQALTEGSSNSFVKWVPGHHMIADGMTKWFSNGSLAKGLVDGRWSLQDTAEAKELRDVAAKRRKSYKK